jgi:hypothetical protein
MLSDFIIQKRDNLIGKAYRNLPAHTNTVPAWDASPRRELDPSSLAEFFGRIRRMLILPTTAPTVVPIAVLILMRRPERYLLPGDELASVRRDTSDDVSSPTFGPFRKFGLQRGCL